VRLPPQLAGILVIKRCEADLLRILRPDCIEPGFGYTCCAVFGQGREPFRSDGGLLGTGAVDDSKRPTGPGFTEDLTEPVGEEPLPLPEPSMQKLRRT